MKNSWFVAFSRRLANLSGHALTFLLAVLLVMVWALTGPIFGFSDTWQLVINTTTGVVTFLMVFLIRSTQHRDTEAIQIKLDELIRATQGAHNALLNLENLDEAQLDEFRRQYQRLALQAKKARAVGASDTDSPDINQASK